VTIPAEPENLSPNAPRRAEALLGGTFNPPHRAHMRLATAALEQLPIDEVLVVPTGDHPHKRDGAVVAAHHRLEMARLCFGDMPGVRLDDREIRRAGLSFTVDTLEELRSEDPERQLWFLIGADNLPLLPTWHRHHRILQLARIATFPRGGCSGLDTEATRAALSAIDLSAEERDSLLRQRLAIEPDPASATGIRDRLREGHRGLPEITADVERYILEHHLYGT
jgi:nicotinate-nucleotide adenylyltransferase